MKPTRDARLCLVSPSHLAANPRLVKEADALHAAGYTVHVVFGRSHPPYDAADAALLRDAAWTHTRVDYAGGLRVAWRKLIRRSARLALERGAKLDTLLATRALHIGIEPLLRAAVAARAHLYIGHMLPALPVVAEAARQTGARYGFDAEDFHSQETTFAVEDRVEAALTHFVESELLPDCAHLTAASPLIAEAYASTYALPCTPTTVLNVFPLPPSSPASLGSRDPSAPSDQPDQSDPSPSPAHATTPTATVGAPAFTAAKPARLYWFSQTIGPGRGLERLLSTLATMRTPCSLHLRGTPAAGFKDTLRAAATSAGFCGEIEFLPFASPPDMIALARGYDLGLSLEEPTPINRDLCLTNKLFTYLPAGLPIALTPTRAQTRLARDLGEAALLIHLDAPAEASMRLDEFLKNPARLQTARATALRLARDRYNWEIEQQALLTTVSAALVR